MHLESFCSFLHCRRKFFATEPAISDIFFDGFRALFTHFLGIFFSSFHLCLSFSASASSWRFASFGFWCLHPIYLHLCLRRQSDSGLGLGLCLGLVFCSCAVGGGGGSSAAVSGKCYLTASVTLHNCSHFLDCATVAVAALLKFIVVLSLLPHIRCHGWCPGHYDYLERITRPRLEPKQK